MKIEQALKYIENAIDYWAEESDYEEKDKDVKKTNQAWTVIVKALGKNDQFYSPFSCIPGVHLDGRHDTLAPVTVSIVPAICLHSPFLSVNSPLASPSRILGQMQD